MNKGCTCAVVMAVAILAWTAQPVSADPIQATFAVTVNPLYGHHEVDGGQRDTISFAAGTLDAPTGLRAAGVPCVVGSSTERLNIETALETPPVSMMALLSRMKRVAAWIAGSGLVSLSATPVSIFLPSTPLWDFSEGICSVTWLPSLRCFTASSKPYCMSLPELE